MDLIQTNGARFNNASSTLAGGSATVTEAASSGKVHFITDLGGSCANATAQIRLYSGDTDFWVARIGDSAYEKSFVVPIAISSGSAVTVEVLSGGGSTYACMSGYTI